MRLGMKKPLVGEGRKGPEEEVPAEKVPPEEVPAVAVWRIPPGQTVVDYGGIS
jgi:hypothetical protein